MPNAFHPCCSAGLAIPMLACPVREGQPYVRLPIAAGSALGPMILGLPGGFRLEAAASGPGPWRPVRGRQLGMGGEARAAQAPAAANQCLVLEGHWPLARAAGRPRFWPKSKPERGLYRVSPAPIGQTNDPPPRSMHIFGRPRAGRPRPVPAPCVNPLARPIAHGHAQPQAFSHLAAGPAG